MLSLHTAQFLFPPDGIAHLVDGRSLNSHSAATTIPTKRIPKGGACISKFSPQKFCFYFLFSYLLWRFYVYIFHFIFQIFTGAFRLNFFFFKFLLLGKFWIFRYFFIIFCLVLTFRFFVCTSTVYFLLSRFLFSHVLCFYILRMFCFSSRFQFKFFLRKVFVS